MMERRLNSQAVNSQLSDCQGFCGLLPKSLFARSETLFDKSKACSSPACSGICEDL
jgi:hypothetical protein